MKLLFAKQRYTNTRHASGGYKPFTQSHLHLVGQQSQVEQWEESGASSNPESGRHTVLLAKNEVCCCLVGFRQGERPQGRGTWNIRPCHGSSAQLSAAQLSSQRLRQLVWARGGAGLEARFLSEASQQNSRWKRWCHSTLGRAHVPQKVGGCLAPWIHTERSEKTFLPGRMQIIESEFAGQDVVSGLLAELIAFYMDIVTCNCAIQTGETMKYFQWGRIWNSSISNTDGKNN